MEFPDLGALLKTIPLLDAELFGAAVVMGAVCRILCASVGWFNGEHTVIVAGILGVLGAVLGFTMEKHPWQAVGLQACSMFVAVFFVNQALKKVIPDNSIGAAKAPTEAK